MPGAIGGALTQRVIITIVDDETEETDETFTVSFDTDNLPTIVTAGTPSSVTVTITDDDAPAITITGGSPVTEGAAATFTVTANPAPTDALTVTLRADDGVGDFLGTNPPTSVLFLANEGTVTLSVPTVDDNTDEADGTITVTLASGTGYTIATPAPSAMVAITDNDDAPTVSFSRTEVTVEEDVTGGSVEVTLELSGPSATALVIPVAQETG